MTTESTNGDEQPTCGHPTTTTGDPCQRQVSTPDDRCYIHADDGGVPDDHGAPNGNQNAVTTGLSMSVKRRLAWFRELDGPWLSLFEDYYVEFHGDAENKSQAAALASLAVIRDRLEKHLLLDGPFYEERVADPEELMEQGFSRDEAMERAFVDKPKTATVEAYTDACREVRLGLNYESISSGGQSSTSGSGGIPDGASAMWED
jgi:hypothetical protein